MLSSIHPLGERARRSTWGVTVAAHVAGSAVGGAVAGGLAALAGGLVLGFVRSDRRGLVSLAVVAVACAVAALADGTGRSRLWATLHRQVDDGWLVRYRGWVYGSGFGFQLGLGVVTIVTTAAVHALWLVAAVQAGPAQGSAVGAVFGLTRALPLLLLAGVERPDQLARFHRRLDAVSRSVRLGGVATLASVAAVAVVGLGATA
jgi:hypothetical protein